MRAPVLFLCSVLAVGTPMAASGSEEEERTRLIEINERILRSMLLDNDPGPLLEHTTEDFVVIAPGGRVENREMVLRGVDSVQADGLELSQEEVRWHHDTAVLIGKLVIDGTMAPMGRFPPMKFMAVFRSIDGDWKLVARSLTPCLPVAVERGVC